ncbi:hypothetical protein [Mangrovimonas futianensis]|uniref:hypothetical protein n=1 Tax=Mangrovimonas futianensis TaxID=2895523 RepID=UPI001E4AA7AB|nr:hypothetical protein [Mangrovimonas futianensis]MCF1420976.1 hypothetical protein [Mangrovimonas futianensis]
MKIILLIITFLVTWTSQSQIINIDPIIPIEDYENYPNDIPNGTYIQDINGVLNPYLGTWEGSIGNKNIEFQIYKVTSTFLEISIDQLQIRYKLTNLSGNVLINTMNIPEEDPLIIKGDYLGDDANYYVLDYYGEEATCGQKGALFIRVFNNGTNMRINFIPNPEIMDMNICPNNQPVEQIFPEEFVLTKQ